MNQTNVTLEKKQFLSVRLYRLVFLNFIPRSVAFLIVASFILQPIARAEANNDDTTATPVVQNESVEPETTSLPTEEVALDPQLDQNQEIVQTENTDSVTSSETVDAPTVDIESASTTPAEFTEEGTTTTADSPVQSTDTVAESESSSGDNVTENVSETEDVLLSVSDSTSSTSTVDTTIPVSTVMSDTQIQFDKSDCVSVADGSFYCQPKKVAPEKDTDGFFALPDSDGDLEIFMQKDGVMTQITHNTIDDAAPFYDAVSQTIVWHRLVDDRYQIMSYDIAKAAETQLTFDTVNNMEPNRAGLFTVWQHWSGENWDIALYDGQTTKIITTALEHDIAPSMRGTLVVWNRLSHDQTQTIELYDVKSGEFTTINDTDGGVISNPRMVLVYESSFENGDVVTKGYDMQTGEIAELATTPVKVPDKIPPADSTGETRALIQVKPGQKEDGEVVDGSLLKTSVSGPNPQPTSSTSTLASSTTTTVAASSSAAIQTTFDMTLDMRTEGNQPATESTDIVLESFASTSITTE